MSFPAGHRPMRSEQQDSQRAPTSIIHGGDVLTLGPRLGDRDDQGQLAYGGPSRDSGYSESAWQPQRRGN